MPYPHRPSNPPKQAGARAISMMDSAMIQAVLLGLDAAVNSFLAQGANPNGVDENGSPILHLAFSPSSDEESIEKIARAMLAAGANPRRSHGAGPSLPERIIRTFSAPSARRLISLISSLGFDIDAPGPGGRTALMWEMDNAKLDDGLCETLLAAGADPGLEDSMGKSAFWRAEQRGLKDALIKMSVAQEKKALAAVLSGPTAPCPKRAAL